MFFLWDYDSHNRRMLTIREYLYLVAASRAQPFIPDYMAIILADDLLD